MDRVGQNYRACLSFGKQPVASRGTPMSRSKTLSFKRRQMLQLAALGTGALYLGAALAQQLRVVVGTWGGDYAKLLTKNVDDPYLKPKGIEVVQDQASDAPRRA